MVEPFDLWWNALGHKFGDRTPRRIDNFLGRGKSAFYHGRKGAEVSEIRVEAAQVQVEEHGLGACGYDPAVRLDFQKEAAVEAEVLNTTHMLYIMGNPDVEVAQACSTVFNDWLAEFVSLDRRRLLGVGMLPMHDMDCAVTEAQQSLTKGLGVHDQRPGARGLPSLPGTSPTTASGPWPRRPGHPCCFTCSQAGPRSQY